MPKVSVVIPCYNQGGYVDEAVDSVLAQNFEDYEIIVVNDGSTDAETNEKLKSYDRPKTKVLQSENRGLAGARNFAIENAEGEYILPLDADDRISSSYLEKAVAILDKKKDVGIVTCEVTFFGEQDNRFDLPPYSLGEILCNNIIICSSFFRRSDWVKAGGYDSSMKYGWEDYEFWLSLIEKGADVERLPETHFFYRKYSGSMADSMTEDQKLYSMDIIYSKHKDLYLNNMDKLFKKMLELKSTAQRCLLDLYSKDIEVNQLRDAVEARQELVISMDAGICGRDAKILELNGNLIFEKTKSESMEKSLSWCITSPLRWICDVMRSRPKESDEHVES